MIITYPTLQNEIIEDRNASCEGNSATNSLTGDNNLTTLTYTPPAGRRAIITCIHLQSEVRQVAATTLDYSHHANLDLNGASYDIMTLRDSSNTLNEVREQIYNGNIYMTETDTLTIVAIQNSGGADGIVRYDSSYTVTEFDA